VMVIIAAFLLLTTIIVMVIIAAFLLLTTIIVMVIMAAFFLLTTIIVIRHKNITPFLLYFKLLFKVAFFWTIIPDSYYMNIFKK
ncbi:hypothetical protein, partial [Peribacillus simplex]|uniref:hypothetical protein n=1 Tax=Peribacillus simplex TaxID=1478 RepID=UPI003D298780